MSLEHISTIIQRIEVVPPAMPAELRSLRVTREQFITPQHYEAWLKGMPLARHLTHRKKLGRDLKEAFAKGHVYQCSLCTCASMLQLDHMVPSALGGSSLLCNFRYLCGTHNLAVARPVNQYLRSLKRYLAEVAA